MLVRFTPLVASIFIRKFCIVVHVLYGTLTCEWEFNIHGFRSSVRVCMHIGKGIAGMRI